MWNFSYSTIFLFYRSSFRWSSVAPDIWNSSEPSLFEILYIRLTNTKLSQSSMFSINKTKIKDLFKRSRHAINLQYKKIIFLCEKKIVAILSNSTFSSNFVLPFSLKKVIPYAFEK